MTLSLILKLWYTEESLKLNIILLVDDEMIKSSMKLISIVASVWQEKCRSVLRFPKALLANYGFL